MDPNDPRNPANHVEQAFDIAERHARIIEREIGTGQFEIVVGVLVLMCCTKPNSTGPSFINAMLHGTPWRLVNREAH